MGTKRIIYSCIIGAILLAILFFFLFLKQFLQVKKLPILGEVADFHLIDSQNKEFTLQKLKGKIWVVDFMFTSCGNICPILTKNMAALHRSFFLVDGVEMLSISVNPENDSPAVLTDFAKKFHADLKKWHFLTGERAEIQRLAVDSFKIGSVKEPVFHLG